MKNSKPTIAIVGGTLWGNRGAEAMLVTTIGQIRKQFPDARFKVFSYYPARDAQLCQDAAIELLDYRPLTLGLKVLPLVMLCGLLKLLRIRMPRFLLGKQISALQQCDVLLDVGGITFCDGREIFLLYNVLSLLPAFVLHVPVVKMSQALGPFKNPINRFLASRILPKCHHVFARGQITAGHLRELGLPRHLWSEASDIAFVFEEELSLTTENALQVEELDREIASRSCQKQVVSIVPSSLVFKKSPAYVDLLTGLVRQLLAADVYVVLLPNATRADSDQGRNNDLVVIRQVLQALQENCPSDIEKLSAVTFDVNTESIRRLMRFSDLVVTSRFHGMVAALSAAIPVVVIGWSHKYGEVLADFEFEQFSFDHASTGTEIIPTVLELLQVPELRQTLSGNLAQVKESSQSQFDFVGKMLANPRLSPADDAAADPRERVLCES